MKGAWLCMLMACAPAGAVTDSLEFEKVEVSQGFSTLSGLSFRTGEVRDTTLTKPDVPGLDAYFSVVENGLGVSGKVVVTTGIETPAGDYAIVISNAGATLTWKVAVKDSTASPRREATRLSTVGLSKSLLYALKEDGTVWRSELLASGTQVPVRVAGLYGVTAVSRDLALTLDGEVIALESGFGPWVTSTSQRFKVPNALDLRDGYVLTQDGRVFEGTRQVPGLADVVVFRSYEFNQGGQHGVVNAAVLGDGTVVNHYLDGSVRPTKLRGVQDISQVASGFLRADGVVFGYPSENEPTFHALTGSASVVAFEGTAFVDRKDVAHELSLYVTADHVAHARERTLPYLKGQVADIAGRENLALLWHTNGSLFRYDLNSTTSLTDTKFAKVRRPNQVADANVFGESVSLKRGETKTVTYRVVRKGFREALTLTPLALPAGVTVSAQPIAAEATSVTLTWTLASGATIEPRTVEFELRGTDFVRTTQLPVFMAAEPRLHTIGSTSYAAFFIKQDGSLWGFGSNINGDLGFTPDAVVHPPLAIAQVGPVKSVAGYGANVMALDAAGNVWTWGSQGGLGYPTPADVQPRKVPGLPVVVSIALGRAAQSLALDESGAVWMWSLSQLEPVKVTGLPKLVEISAFDEPHGLDGEGNVWRIPTGGQVSKRSGAASVAVPCARLGFERVDGASAKNFATCLPGDGLPASDGALIIDMPGSGQVISLNAAGVRSLNSGGNTTQDTVDATQAIGLSPAKIFALKLDGTLWEGYFGGAFTQVAGVTGIRLP